MYAFSITMICTVLAVKWSKIQSAAMPMVHIRMHQQHCPSQPGKYCEAPSYRSVLLSSLHLLCLLLFLLLSTSYHIFPCCHHGKYRLPRQLPGSSVAQLPASTLCLPDCFIALNSSASETYGALVRCPDIIQHGRTCSLPLRLRYFDANRCARPESASAEILNGRLNLPFYNPRPVVTISLPQTDLKKLSLSPPAIILVRVCHPSSADLETRKISYR